MSYRFTPFLLSQPKASTNQLTAHPDDELRFDATAQILASVRKGTKPGDAARPIYEKLGLEMPSDKSISQAVQGWSKSLITAANKGNKHAIAAIQKHLSDHLIPVAPVEAEEPAAPTAPAAPKTTTREYADGERRGSSNAKLKALNVKSKAEEEEEEIRV